MTDHTPTAPHWDLSDLYKITEKEWSDLAQAKEIKTDIDNLHKISDAFATNYKGKIASISGSNLAKAISEYEKIDEKIGRVTSFAYLNYSTKLLDQNILRFYQSSCELATVIAGKLVFFVLEINELEDDELEKKLKSSEQLSHYKPFIKEVRKFRKYQLTEDLEKVLLDKANVSRQGWISLFDETLAGLEFEVAGKTLSAAQALNILSDSDRAKRSEAAAVISKVFAKNAKIFATVFNNLIKDKEIDDKWRKYESMTLSRHLANSVEDEVVDLMVSTVKENYSKLSHRYYKIKAKWLGLDKMSYSDRNAPLPNSIDTTYTYEEAKKTVLESYEKFSPEFAAIAKNFFEKPWIDAKVYKGKESGAYCHPTVPSVHPYVMMNFLSKTRDVATLAHEVGHAVHQTLANKHGILMSQTPLTLAETASVFAEQLTFRHILEQEKNPQTRKAIIASKVEDMLNTVVRQVAFYDFETRIHKLRREQGLVSVEQINQTWLDVQSNSLGDAFDFTEDYAVYWCYISHFIHAPFYVYAYAFGDCLVNSLYSIYLKGSIKDFPAKYMEMLGKAGTEHHSELLAPFGLDIRKKEFWQGGLDVIAGFIDELE